MCFHDDYCECLENQAVYSHGMGQNQVLEDLKKWAEKLMEKENPPDLLDVLEALADHSWLNQNEL